MKRNCINCHFLVKENVNDLGTVHTLMWNDEELSRKDVASYYGVRCFRGVWDTGINPALRQELNALISNDRGSSCFYYPRQPGMALATADELQKKDHEYGRLKRSNLYTKIGLMIASSALIVDLIIRLFEE